MLCSITHVPFSSLMGRLHFAASITLRFCSHKWVLANWMWVGPWLILAFIIFWKILKLVIVVNLTLPFPPSSYTIGRGVFGTAGIHSHSWLEECTMSKHHHYPDSEAEGPDDATRWGSCLIKPQPKLDTWRVWEKCLICDGFFQLRKSSWNCT